MDEASFEGWARSRVPTLLRVVTALTGNREDAGDLVQDALVKVYSRWSRVCSMDRPDGYVTRIMVNRHISDRRRADRAAPREALFAPVDVPPTDGGALDRAELVPALQTLGARQRTVLILRYTSTGPTSGSPRCWVVARERYEVRRPAGWPRCVPSWQGRRPGPARCGR